MKWIILVSCAAILFAASSAFSQSYSIDSHTFGSGGGISVSAGFQVSGTIGQYDAPISAEPMSGGAFEATGGFWPAPATTCTCLGDLNFDGNRNGADIATFVGCFLEGGACLCADLNGINGVDIDDVQLFVQDLLETADCP